MGESEDVPPSKAPQHIDFVRPPPEPPLTERQRKWAWLATFGEVLVALGIFGVLGGCGVTCAALGVVGLPAAGIGLALIVVGLVLRRIATA